MCDLTVRLHGNVQRHTVQCLLIINMFNEIVYMVMWFWLIFLAIATFLNLLRWLLDMVFPCARSNFVRMYVHAPSVEDKSDLLVLNEFVKELSPDGVLVMRLIQKNAGDIVLTELLGKLYGSFKEINGNEEIGEQ